MELPSEFSLIGRHFRPLAGPGALDLQDDAAVLKRYDVVGGYDPNAYQSERTHARAADGTMVPISLVYKKGLAKNGRSPMLLEAYGSYGAPYDVYFSSTRLLSNIPCERSLTAKKTTSSSGMAAVECTTLAGK